MNIKVYLLKYICISFTLLLCNNTYSQLLVKAKVYDTDSKNPLHNVIIVSKDSISHTIRSFISSNKDGSFEIEVKKNCVLEFSKMAYAKKIIEPSFFNSKKLIFLVSKPVNIDNVNVHSKRISHQGDTISYFVDSFVSAKDKNIGDVLKKMPGIEVTKSGRVLYNGKAINRFYIEGADLLNKQYSLAVNNLSPRDIGRVQVMENHQPLKVMEGYEFSDRAALNITLKESSKSTWIKYGELMGGFPSLWKSLIMAMRISAKNQSLNLYKSNNIGENIVLESQSISLEDLMNNDGNQENTVPLISLYPNTNLSLKENRSLDNRTHLITTNTLWTLKRKAELKLNASYVNDYTRNELSSKTTYNFEDDNNLQIRENQTGTSKQDIIKLKLTYNQNKDKSFIENKLEASYTLKNVDVNTIGSVSNTQDAELNKVSVENNFKLIKKYDDKLYKISSYTSFNSLPHRLHIKEIKNTKNTTYTEQKAFQSDFFNNTNVSFSKSFGRVLAEIKTGLRTKVYELDTELNSAFTKQETNKISLSNLNYYFQPKLNFIADKLNIELSLPFNFHSSNISGKTYNNFLVSPSIKTNYKFNQRFKAAINYTYKTDIDISQVYSNIIMQSYRSMQQGYAEPSTPTDHNFSANFRYKNPIKELFFSSMFSLNISNKDLISNQTFKDIYSVSKQIKQSNRYKSILIYNRISKGFAAIGSTLSLNYNYFENHNSMMLNSELIKSNSKSHSLGSKIICKKINWLDIDYMLSYIHIQTKLSNINTINKYQNWKQNLNLYFTLSEKLFLGLNMEYYQNQISVKKHKQCLFADFTTSFHYNSTLEFRMSLLNIFDYNNYQYSIRNDIYEQHYIYKLRPRNILIGAYFKF